MRRAPFLVAWWTNGGARVSNYATMRTVEADLLALEILDRTSTWMTIEDLLRALVASDPNQVHDSIDELLAHDMLQSLDRPGPPEEAPLAKWRGWNPAAGFFHRATRVNEWAPVGPGAGPPIVCLQDATAVGQHRPGPRLELPEFERGGALAETLLARRTWRRFGTRRVTLHELSTLLGLTFAVQHWIDIDGERVPLRTSPSGGARHSVEAYVAVLDIDGIDAGTYHYCPDRHALLRLDDARPDAAQLFPAGSGFDRAGAIVLATSVFGRVQRKYESPRAYRVVLLETGHFCQTFCLVATSLGLAPFCTAAFADDAVDRLLRIDGIGEAALYAMGVGSRPEGTSWALWPFNDIVPAVAPPAYAARFDRTDGGGEP
jgi:SagB-type dehydrogenase family enzyme